VGVSAAAAGPGLTADDLAVLDAVEAGATHPDGIASVAALGADRAAASIARLELGGYLAAVPSGTAIRTTLPAPGGRSRQLRCCR
jgi:hypothetical protein